MTAICLTLNVWYIYKMKHNYLCGDNTMMYLKAGRRGGGGGWGGGVYY